MDRFCKTTYSTYYLTIYFIQILFYWTITSGKSVRIDMRTDPSVYPCLDSFDILVTTPNISDEKYNRLIRVYTTNHFQRFYANTLKLEYIKEYKLPLNNYLKIDCHFFSDNYRYYCFVFVALSRTTGAVLINGRPHCRPTTMQLIVTSTASSDSEDNTINSLAIDESLAQLRPAGPSYKYNYPTKSIVSTVYSNSRRVGTGSNQNKFDDNYFEQLSDEDIAHYINIDCQCNNIFDIESNVSTVVITLGIVFCNNNNNNNNQKYLDNNLFVKDIDSKRSTVYSPTYSDSDLIEKNIKNKKNKSYLSDASDESTGSTDTDTNGNYLGILSTICILNLTEGNYKMKVQYENRQNIPVIYVQSTHTPHLVVREGRLAIDPQLDINNKSQIHSLKSQYLRIESFYAQNLTLKLILLKSNHILVEKSRFNTFLSTLTPIHYTSMALILLVIMALLALISISLWSPQRKTTVKIVTPSEEGDQTHTSYVAQTDIMSEFSLPDDNQSLEMDYYDLEILPFVPRPHSRATDLDEK